MTNRLIIEGVVTRKGGDLPIAGLRVDCRLIDACLRYDDAKTSNGECIALGTATTDSAGRFAIDSNDVAPESKRWVCALQHCDDFQVCLECLDTDDSILLVSGPMACKGGARVALELDEPVHAVAADDWASLAQRLEARQLDRLDLVAQELSALSPYAMFADWTVTHRLALLGQIEQALLDPRQAFAEAGIAIRFAELLDGEAVQERREGYQRTERAALVDALDLAVERAHLLEGWHELLVPIVPGDLGRESHVPVINRFMEGPSLHAQFIDGEPPPVVGYRDYLRNGWCDRQRKEYQLVVGWVEVASLATMIQRLNNRFHQEFATDSASRTPANRLAAEILARALIAADGTGYGFGVAAGDIKAKGDRSDREYLDYLITLTGLDAGELEKRYRIDLGRSDLEWTSPVLQNIHTLQRFFTDSHQSVDDPYAVKPDRKPGKNELIIIQYPQEAAGPFFLQYEEWLAREEPFFAENHYNPRRTYRIEVSGDALQKVLSRTQPLREFLQKPVNYPPNNTAGCAWQWVRNHLELQDLINAAHGDVEALNPPAAEAKYQDALALALNLRGMWMLNSWDPYAKRYVQWDYAPLSVRAAQRNADVSSMAKLEAYEAMYHVRFLSGDVDSSTEPSKWWGDRWDLWPQPGNRRTIAYLLDHLCFRLLPAWLSEVLLTQGKYAAAVRQLMGRSLVYQQSHWWFPGVASFHVFASTLEAEAFGSHTLDGTHPYATSSDRTQYPKWDDPWTFPKVPPVSVPSNRGELGYYKLRLGHTVLEWADALYRSNEPDSIMRARELYKGVIYLHGEDPEISPSWDRLSGPFPVFPWKKSKRNPAVTGQLSRAHVGFLQINAGLNYYGVTDSHVPPVRYRVLKEAGERFAVGAQSAQSDFLSYLQQLDTLAINELTVRAVVQKAEAAIAIVDEQKKIAEFHVGETQKQVDAVRAQISAKRAEIAKADEFFEQVKSFAGGMKDSVMKLGQLAFAGESQAAASGMQKLSTGDILKLGFKVGTATNVLGTSASTLAGAGGVAGPFGAFLYAGVSSMTSMADAIAKRGGELKQLENVTLPAALALVELKRREVTIASLHRTIAATDRQLGRDLLAHYTQRVLNHTFLVSMAECSNRIMRHYLDLAGRTAWLAERALAFEQDRELRVIKFDYFPRNRQGVSGADQLQLHLAELEAARLQGLMQTIPVKVTVSLAREFPLELGQLKRTGECRIHTEEAGLSLVYPGVFGYRLRAVTVSASYANAEPPHRGMLTNNGVSFVSKDKIGSQHALVRYPDALPLSEFRMRDDMWVFDLPDETLLPFEGSGIDTVWEIAFPKAGNARDLSSLTDLWMTFDMRASYSSTLRDAHRAAQPTTVRRTVMISGSAVAPDALVGFRENGGMLALSLDLPVLARNSLEQQRTVQNLVIALAGIDEGAVIAQLQADTSATDVSFNFDDGIAMSNAGVLAGGNGGVALPLNIFCGLDLDQTFEFTVDATENPAIDFARLRDLIFIVEYEATLSM